MDIFKILFLSRFSLSQFFCCALLLLVVIACDRKEPIEESVTPTEKVVSVDPSILPRTEAAWLKGISFANESVNEAESLQNAIQKFLQDPNDETLTAARESWHTSHTTYTQLEMFITLGLSNPGLFGQLIPTNFLIDAQPILPGYLDYFDVYANSGIVNDIAMPLAAESLRAQHGFSDETEVSLGFHAIEYLLWGETGARLADDYLDIQELDTTQRSTGVRIIDLPNNRRRVLLNLLSVLLTDDISQLKQQLENPADTVRQNYSALTPLSRMQLLQAAAYSMLAQRIEWINNFNASEAEAISEQEETIEQASTNAANDPILHNQFSADEATLFYIELRTINNILFDENIGFADWILSNEQLPLLAQFQETIQMISAEDFIWPPNETERAEMIGSLSLFAEAIAPPSVEE
ncbi:hypothetical protein NBRC116493_28530 [Aurantivibrio infirmus]